MVQQVQSYRRFLPVICTSIIMFGIPALGQVTPPGGPTIGDPGSAPPNAVLTFHNDMQRTGLFPVETKLTTSNVNFNTFGKLFSDSVDGFVYAQPLYVPGVLIPGKGLHNIVYVCTEHDSVYAFDADTGGGALWMTSFLTSSNVTTVPSADVNSTDIVPEIGISGTPVIAYYANTIFVEAKTKEMVNGAPNYVHRLHALDIRTGAEKPGSPVVITATVPGTGDGNNGKGQIVFNGLTQHFRPGLLLSQGIVWLAAASHGDNGPYHGWVFGYDPSSLKQLYVLNLTPNGGLGGIWMSGAGMAADNWGDMYFATGNGTFSADPTLGNGIDYGDSFVRVAVSSGKLGVVDYFSPFNQQYLNDVDGDLGSGGLLIPPTQGGKYPNIVIGCGKQGRIYVVNRDNMSHFHADSDHVLQTLDAVVGTWSMPAYFNNHIYYNAQGDILKSFGLSNGLLTTTPVSQSNVYLGYPGSTPSISANGTQNGIIWLVESSAFGSNGQAILYAFNAANLTQMLYNSNQAAAGRDNPGAAVKFTVPTITGGKVYVGTQNSVTVFGLLNQ